MNSFMYNADNVMWSSKHLRVRGSGTAESTEKAWLKREICLGWLRRGSLRLEGLLRKEHRKERERNISGHIHK